MKTVEEKAQRWVLDNVVLSENCDIEYSDVVNALALLLKEQDRDTRHACAEAVVECGRVLNKDVILPMAAHLACMNAKAI